MRSMNVNVNDKAKALCEELYDEKQKVSSTLFAMSLTSGELYSHFKIEGDNLFLLDSHNGVLEERKIGTDVVLVWRKRKTVITEEFIPEKE